MFGRTPCYCYSKLESPLPSCCLLGVAVVIAAVPTADSILLQIRLVGVVVVVANSVKRFRIYIISQVVLPSLTD